MKRIKRLLTRIVALMLVVVLAVPGNLVEAFAQSNTDTDASYGVTIEQSENGTIAFANGSTDMTIFNPGDTIEVKMTPNEGYQVKEFKIVNAENNKVLAFLETTDDTFSFTMPKKNLIVTGLFVEYDGVERESGTTQYITLNIEEDSVEEVAGISSDTLESLDIVAEDPIIVDKYDENGLAQTTHKVFVNYSLLDSTMVTENTTIENMWDDGGATFYANFPHYVPIYSMKDNEDCYVAFLNPSEFNNMGDIVDAAFVLNDDTNPVSLEEVLNFDKETGILYIPKALFVGDDGEEIDFIIRSQVAISYDINTQTMNIPVIIENNNSSVEEVAIEQTITVPTMDVTVTVPLVTSDTAYKLDADKVKVFINDETTPLNLKDTDYYYDEETGEYSFVTAPIVLYSIKIVIDDNTVGENIASLFNLEANAISRDEIRSVSDLDALDLNLKVDGEFKVGQVFKFPTFCKYVGNNVSGQNETPSAILGNAYYKEDYCYYTPNADIMWTNLQSGSHTFESLMGSGVGYVYNGGEQLNFFITPPVGKFTSVGNVGGTVTFPSSKDWVGEYCDGGAGSEPYLVPRYDWAEDYPKASPEPYKSYISGVIYDGSTGVSSTWTEDHNVLANEGPKPTAEAYARSSTSNCGAYGNEEAVFSYTASMIPLSCGHITSAQTETFTKHESGYDGYMRILNVGDDYVVAAFYVPVTMGEQTPMSIYKITTNPTTPSYVKVKKVTANGYEECVADNKMYSLKNAEFTIYTDIGCTKVAKDVNGRNAILVTDDNGDTSVLELNKGTYYIKETKAPQGYTINIDPLTNEPYIYKCEITEANTSNNPKIVEIADEPINDPIAVKSMGKIDMTSEGEVVKKGLAGAEYTVNYYDDADITEDEIKAGTVQPTNTWVFKSPESGLIDIDIDTPIMGEFTYTPEGYRFFPLGTYTIAETKAPDGYAKSGRITLYDDLQQIVGVPFDFEDGDFFTIRVVQEEDANGNFVSTVAQHIEVAEVYHSLNENYELTISEETNLFGFSINKKDFDTESDAPQGDAQNLKATFELINNYGSTVWVDLDQDGARDEATEYFEHGDVCFTFETDEDGKYTSYNKLVQAGEYIIREKATGAPGGYLNSGRIEVALNTINDANGNPYAAGTIVPTTYDIANEVIRGGFKLQKTDSDGRTYYSETLGEYVAEIPQGNATFVDTTFTLTNKSTSYVMVDTDGDGTLEKYEPNEIVKTFVLDDTYTIEVPNDYLPYGTYELAETVAPEGYNLPDESDTITFSIREDGQMIEYVFDATNNLAKPYTEDIKRGGFEITKKDAETDSTTPLSGSNLEATFNVINLSDSYVWVDSNENGEFDSNECYLPNEVVFTFKTDADTGYYKSADDLLPYGKYKIVEVKAPNGYLILGSVSNGIEFEVEEDGSIYDGNDHFKNYVKRGDVKFVKRNASDGSTMAYIPFKITALDKDGNEIESHIVYTDENGVYSSATSYVEHTYNTNQGDTIYADYIAYYEANGEYKDLVDVTEYGKAGTWFGIGTTPSDNLRLDVTGALPYGKYKIEELPCERNEGYKMFVDTFEITKDVSSTTIEIDPDGYRYNGEAGLVDLGTIYNFDAPELDTEALVDGTHTALVSDYVVIVDSVSYFNFQKNTTYKLVATLYDIETMLPITDVDGSVLTTEKTFTTSSKAGTTRVDIAFDATGYDGKSIVVYEELYDENGTFIVGHTDSTDEDQMIMFPSIDTELTDTNGNHMVKPEKEITLVDRVQYKNLTIGSTYKVQGYLIDKDTNDYALDDNGNKIYAEATFKVTDTDGYIDVEYVFDGETLGGKTLVAFEEVLRGKDTIAAHMDINSEKQTIYIPTISTSALDMKSELQMGLAQELTTIVDTVTYKNLKIGEEYTINGTIMKKGKDGSESELLDNEGNPIVATKTFVATEMDGSINIEFTFDSSLLAGTTVVVFEELEYNGETLVVHADINDDDQTIYFPKVGTTVINPLNNTHYVESNGTYEIVDTVAYENVIPGETYIVRGILMDKSTNLPLERKYRDDGITHVGGSKYVEAYSEHFVAEAESGTIEVTFEIDADMYTGQTMVVFETLYHYEEKTTYRDVDTGEEVDPETYDKELIVTEVETTETPVAKHEDIDDVAQTIYDIKIGTTATDENTTINVAANGSTVIVDKVFYEGLVPGQEYVISGKLMEKVVDAEGNVTAKPFTTDDTKAVSDVETLISGILGKSNEYISEIRFTPEKSSGYVDIKFNIDTTKLGGRSIVVYEKLYFETTLIASHEDINDEGQTVHIPSIGTTATDKSTSSKYLSYGKEVVISDTVTYKNLVPGKEYKLVGTLMDKATGKPITGTVILATSTDANGNPASSAALQEIIATTTFTPEKADGEVVVEFKVNATELKGKTLVVYEKLYYGEAVIAVHEDIKDEAQTIYVPEIGTVATVDGEHQAKRSTNTTLIDKVEYKNLVPGTVYTITGTLMDKETGKAIVVDGKPITTTTTFKPEKASGTTEVKFTFDSTKCSKVVVFEEVYIVDTKTSDKTTIAEHKDINDANQTVEFSDDKKDTTEVKTGENNLLMILLGVLAAIMCSVTFFFVRKRKVKKI